MVYALAYSLVGDVGKKTTIFKKPDKCCARDGEEVQKRDFPSVCLRMITVHVLCFALNFFHFHVLTLPHGERCDSCSGDLRPEAPPVWLHDEEILILEVHDVHIHVLLLTWVFVSPDMGFCVHSGVLLPCDIDFLSSGHLSNSLSAFPRISLLISDLSRFRPG